MKTISVSPEYLTIDINVGPMEFMLISAAVLGLLCYSKAIRQVLGF